MTFQRKLLKRKSGRPGSNRRRPAWEAGILPLNYSRLTKELTIRYVTFQIERKIPKLAFISSRGNLKFRAMYDIQGASNWSQLVTAWRRTTHRVRQYSDAFDLNR